MLSTIHLHVEISPGKMTDYHQLQPFHYRRGHPGAMRRIFKATYRNPDVPPDHPEKCMLAGVIVESLPALACTLRRIALPGVFECRSRSLSAAKLNRDLRTISRVIVHPIFRSAGLAIQLVKHLLANAQTPYIEALAAMGRVHPLFKLAGMMEFDRPPLPAHVRLLAALAHENLSPLDLVDCRRIALSPFLLAELRRFAGRDASEEQLIRRARERLLSQPLYYLWRRPT